MATSKQDSYYMDTEGNDFFERNFKNRDLPQLRTSKQTIADNITQSGIEFESLLEFGCNYGDLLNHYHSAGKKCLGIEASSDAIEFGLDKYQNTFPIEHGTICENTLSQNTDKVEKFDLILIDDVFGWVSRETILQSIANIDKLLNENGFIYIRDFLPNKRVKNKNHHVKDTDIYNFKVPASHAKIFLATGCYETYWQTNYYDNIGMSTDYKCDNKFNYRWTDIILQKSTTGYFDESMRS